MSGTELIRSLNKQRILQTVRTGGPLSRADLAVLTGLTRPTVSAAVAELLDEGWLWESGPGASSGGRRPTLLRFAADARLALGAELSAGHIRAVAVDLDGRILSRAKERVQSDDATANLDRVAASAAGLLAGLPSGARVAGIGVGITGMVDQAAGLWRYSPHFPGPEQPVARRLADRLGIPALVENDARCLALSEYHFGDAPGVRSLVAVRVGVGLGAGILLDGLPYGGVDGGAGELGHVQVVADGPRCTCGRYGCLEAVAAAGAIARSAARRIARGEPSALTAMVGGELDALLASDVIAAAEAGDGLAAAVLAEAGRLIGVAVGNLINLLNPERVVIGGGTGRAGAFLLEPLAQTALARALPLLRERVRIASASFGEYGVAVGGAAMVVAGLLAAPLPVNV